MFIPPFVSLGPLYLAIRLCAARQLAPYMANASLVFARALMEVPERHSYALGPARMLAGSGSGKPLLELRPPQLVAGAEGYGGVGQAAPAGQLPRRPGMWPPCLLLYTGGSAAEGPTTDKRKYTAETPTLASVIHDQPTSLTCNTFNSHWFTAHARLR